MAKIFSYPGESAPQITSAAVQRFFEERAIKSTDLGATRAVIYQDKHPNLAERRDTLEKNRLLAKIAPSPTDRILDLGCGTGRWTGCLTASGAYYHGIDASAGLLQIARDGYPPSHSLRFTAVSVDDVSLERLSEPSGFNKVLSFGLLLYLNDDAAEEALRAMARVAAPSARIVLREPVGLLRRLTLVEHYSVDLEQTYSAVYRTESELLVMADKELGSRGFQLRESGDMFDSIELNNRAETKQRWFVFERSQ